MTLFCLQTSYSYHNRKLLTSRAPTEAKSQEPAYSQALNQNKIDRQRSRSRESCRQTVRLLWWRRCRRKLTVAPPPTPSRASIPNVFFFCFRFPPIFDKFSDSVENFQHFTFSAQISRFSSAKISDDLFFSHRPQILNFSPIFPI